MNKQTVKTTELSVAFNSVKEKIESISNDAQQFLYATHSKYLPKLGYIAELSMQGVVQAARFLNDLNASNFDKEMKEFEIDSSELGLAATDKYLGVNIDIWKSDLKTRIKELRHKDYINRLRNDMEILQRNLDKSDIKKLDFAKLSTVSIED